MFTRTKAALATAAVAAVSFVPATTGAAADTPYCSGAEQVIPFPNAGFNVGPAATLVVAWSIYPTSLTVAAAIPAGEYDVVTTAYDGYTGRTATNEQAFEQYVLEFLDADGLVIATSGMNADLEDFVEEATWTGPVGTVVLDRPATAVRATHAHLGNQAVIDIGEAQSVQPSCFGVTEVPPTTTTTTTPTTSEPPTTTEPTTSEPPTTTEPTTSEPPTTEPPTTTILGPTTSVTTTTTTVPTQVLPSSQEMPDPDPVAATPTFTG